MTLPSAATQFDEIDRVRRSSADAQGAAHAVRPFSPPTLTIASLFENPAITQLLAAFETFGSAISVPIECKQIPAALARGGTVGRIGVAREATATMQQQQIVIGATVGRDLLAPVPRLWRGLQRRAEVTIDLRQCTTLPGSAADRVGNQRDILLFSQRVPGGSPRRRGSGGSAGSEMAHDWARARDAAETAYRLCAVEQRRLLLVLPVGRSTAAQQLFTEALVRQARLHRMPPPRTVKAGLLSALLSGDAGRERWLVASVISIDELSTMACEAVGDTGPWPVISLGRHALFCDMPASAAAAVDPLPLMLVIATLLQRDGRVAIARTLMQAALVTSSAEWRMREELGTDMPVPVQAYLSGVLANWGRAPVAIVPRDRRAVRRDATPVVTGLRLRIETTLSAAALREEVTTALVPTGLEVASVRSAEGRSGRETYFYDVRVRSRLGEPPLDDTAALAMASALSDSLRCVSVEPWLPMAVAERVPAGAIAGRV